MLQKKRKLPELNKKIFPYELVIAYWEDIVSDASWVDNQTLKNQLQLFAVP